MTKAKHNNLYSMRKALKNAFNYRIHNVLYHRANVILTSDNKYVDELNISNNPINYRF